MLALALVGIGRAFDGEVGRFSAVGGEENLLLAVGADQCGHLLARPLESIPDPKPVLVQRRGVAEVLCEVRPHGIEDLRQNRGGGLMIEEDLTHG